jgi:hypothetical protein
MIISALSAFRRLIDTFFRLVIFFYLIMHYLPCPIHADAPSPPPSLLLLSFTPSTILHFLFTPSSHSLQSLFTPSFLNLEVTPTSSLSHSKLFFPCHRRRYKILPSLITSSGGICRAVLTYRSAIERSVSWNAAWRIKI